MTLIKSLREGDRSSAASYHLEGLLEAQEKIRSLVTKLDASYGLDDESTASWLTELQEEIYFHCVFHMKELRGPLADLVKAAYEKIPDIEPEREEELPDLPEPE